MAKDSLTPDPKPEAASAPAAPPKASLLKKILVIGVPVFLVQVVVIYFIAVKFFFPHEPALKAEAKIQQEDATTADSERQVYVVSDLIVNPAGTNGTRFLLTTVGVEVDSPQTKAELEKKDIRVRDALITILTGKGLDQLGKIEQREMLRAEIAQKIGEILTTGKPKNIYFGKFIIQ